MRGERAIHNGWIASYMNPVLLQFFDELKTHPNKPYQPYGERMSEVIPQEYR